MIAGMFFGQGWPCGQQCGKAEGEERMWWFLNAHPTLCHSRRRVVIGGFAKRPKGQQGLRENHGHCLCPRTVALGGYTVVTAILSRRGKTDPPLTFSIPKISIPPHHFQLMPPQGISYPCPKILVQVSGDVTCF